MTSGAKSRSDQGIGWAGLVYLALGFFSIVIGRWWPGTAAATLASYAFVGYSMIWFSLSVRKGYLLRRPHWTRESWIRYTRLAVMPIVALAIVLYMSSFDPMTPVFGPPRSPTRMAFAIGLTALLILGAIGLAVAVGWMTNGEPSQQFTRTRWFQRDGAKRVTTGTT